MKKLFITVLFLSCIGCANINVPRYIQDKNPYEKIFYAPFEDVRGSVFQAFEASGWTVENESEPALFERERELAVGNKQTLIFTGVRELSLFVGSRYVRINAYVHEIADNETEVEIRYLTVTSTVFKSFYGYKNDQAVEHIFSKIEEYLKL